MNQLRQSPSYFLGGAVFFAAALIIATVGTPDINFDTAAFSASPTLSTSLNANGSMLIKLGLEGGDVNPFCSTSLQFSTDRLFSSKNSKSFLIGSANYSKGTLKIKLSEAPVQGKAKKLKTLYSRLRVDCNSDKQPIYSGTQVLALTKLKNAKAVSANKFLSNLVGKALALSLEKARKKFTTALNVRPISNAAPTISEQPQSAVFAANQDLMFRVIASGSAPATYIWRFTATEGLTAKQLKLLSKFVNSSGELIPQRGIEVDIDAAGASLILRAALVPTALFNGGFFNLVITNEFGSVTSDDAGVSVYKRGEPTPTPVPATPTATPATPPSKYECTSVSPDPGRVTLHRLNNSEYNNTVRDLLGTTLRPASGFPADSSGEGFDNIADVLSISPLLMESYASAAENLANNVLPQVTAQTLHFDYPQLTATTGAAASDAWNLYSNGDMYGNVNIAGPGNYKVRFNLSASQAGPELARMSIKVDDNAILTTNVTNALPTYQSYEVTLSLVQGNHKFAVAFLNDFYDAAQGLDRNLFVKYLEIEGPTGVSSVLPAFVTCQPSGSVTVNACASQILGPLAERAFRRPVTSAEVSRLVTLVSNAISEGDSFLVGLNNALQAILISPDFLFRVELDIDPNNPSVVKTLSAYELASRLSYFLWSSMPDSELFSRAADNTLLNDAVLSAQVTRMLADSKSRALIDNFASSWLYLRKFDESQPDATKFPGFTSSLKQAMRTETEMYFQAMKDENRSVTEFVDSNFTYLNDALASHYGISGVSGATFRKVTLGSGQRGGVLTHASILTATSKPADTSPVKRGKWMLGEILCSAPPPPPPNVDALAGTVDPNATKRVQLAQHRENPVCSSCHSSMDPIGLGFENFNPIGAWRTLDKGLTIDPSGTLPSGQTFADNMQLKSVIKSSPNFPNCVTEKIATYAIGREMSANDRCRIGELTKQTAPSGNKLVDIIVQVIKSDLFRKRRGEMP